jgi:hypothetical protein
VKSVAQKLEQLDAMLGTTDLTEWEQNFISDIGARGWRNSTEWLSEKQLNVIERIWSKHFA